MAGETKSMSEALWKLKGAMNETSGNSRNPKELTVQKRVDTLLDELFLGTSNLKRPHGDIRVSNLLDGICLKFIKETVPDILKAFPKLNFEFYVQLAKAACLMETGTGSCEFQTARFIVLSLLDYNETKDEDDIPIFTSLYNKPVTRENGDNIFTPYLHTYAQIFADRRGKVSELGKYSDKIKVSSNTRCVDPWLAHLMTQDGKEILTPSEHNEVFEKQVLPYIRTRKEDIHTFSCDMIHFREDFARIREIVNFIRQKLSKKLEEIVVLGCNEYMKQKGDVRKLYVNKDEKQLLESLLKAFDANNVNRIQKIGRILRFIKPDEPLLEAHECPMFVLLYLVTSDHIFHDNKPKCCEILLHLLENMDDLLVAEDCAKVKMKNEHSLTIEGTKEIIQGLIGKLLENGFNSSAMDKEKAESLEKIKTECLKASKKMDIPIRKNTWGEDDAAAMVNFLKFSSTGIVFGVPGGSPLDAEKFLAQAVKASGMMASRLG